MRKGNRERERIGYAFCVKVGREQCDQMLKTRLPIFTNVAPKVTATVFT